MNIYIIQHRVHTLARYYTDINNCIPSFELDGMKFSHWAFSFAEGHKTQYWLIEAQISADNFRVAFFEFSKKISPVIAKVSLLSQCYSEYLNEPYLIHRKNSNIAFFRYVKSSRGVPLSFNDNSLKALKVLQERQDINAEFYYY